MEDLLQTSKENVKRMINSPTYYSWASMKNRCTNPKAKSFSKYGGRGISFVKRWEKFENFYFDMGERPSLLHSIERLNNNKCYSKSNCIWATRTQQARNRSITKLTITKAKYIRNAYSQEKKSQRELAIKFNCSRRTIRKVLAGEIWKER